MAKTSLWMCCLMLSALVARGQLSPPVIATISPNEVHTTLHQPAEAILTIQNLGPSTAYVDLGDNKIGGIEMRVTRPDGTSLTGRIPVHNGLSEIGRVQLAGRKRYEQTLILDRWIQFPEEGTYKVAVSFENPAQLPHGATVELRPLLVTVIVDSRDTEMLSTFCSRQVTSILNAPSYADALQAAQSLRYASDPVAIPYLKRALASPYPIQSVLIDGLARIGTDDAFRVLLALLEQRRTSETGELRTVLLAAEERISDPNLRSEVKKALEDTSR